MRIAGLILVLAVLVFLFANNKPIDRSTSTSNGRQEAIGASEPIAQDVEVEENVKLKASAPTRRQSTSPSSTAVSLENSTSPNEVERNETNGLPFGTLSSDNLGKYFYSEPSRAQEVMLAAVNDEERSDWALDATQAVNQVLLDSGLQDFADDWSIDCRTTICVVKFESSALRKFDPRFATARLEEQRFEVVWQRDYKKDLAFAFLVTPEFKLINDAESPRSK